MNLILWLLLISNVYSHSGPVLLPNLTLTPGVVRTTDAKEICAASFRTEPFRRTTAAMKNQVYKEYGVVRNKGVCAGGCEVDHLVPLELGGLDDVKNLWPQPSQPTPGFHEKDKLENFLRREVCAGRKELPMAQRELQKNWYKAYVAEGLGR
jgi:hypothetical protein